MRNVGIALKEVSIGSEQTEEEYDDDDLEDENLNKEEDTYYQSIREIKMQKTLP